MKSNLPSKEHLLNAKKIFQTYKKIHTFFVFWDLFFVFICLYWAFKNDSMIQLAFASLFVLFFLFSSTKIQTMKNKIKLMDHFLMIKENEKF